MRRWRRYKVGRRRSNDQANSPTSVSVAAATAAARACREACISTRAAAFHRVIIREGHVPTSSNYINIATRLDAPLFTARDGRACANCQQPASFSAEQKQRRAEAGARRGRPPRYVPLTLDTPAFLHRICHLTDIRHCSRCSRRLPPDIDAVVIFAKLLWRISSPFRAPRLSIVKQCCSC